MPYAVGMVRYGTARVKDTEYLEEQGDQIAARVAVPMSFDDSPWSPFKKRLSESKVAVLTTGGIYVEGQRPFDTDMVSALVWSTMSTTVGIPAASMARAISPPD